MEKVHSPSHYNQYDIEAIDMMERIWGTEQALIFCKLNAFKYRLRLGLKDDINQDFEKEQWYLRRMNELKEKLGNQELDDLFPEKFA